MWGDRVRKSLHRELRERCCLCFGALQGSEFLGIDGVVEFIQLEEFPLTGPEAFKLPELPEVEILDGTQNDWGWSKASRNFKPI